MRKSTQLFVVTMTITILVVVLAIVSSFRRDTATELPQYGGTIVQFGTVMSLFDVRSGRTQSYPWFPMKVNSARLTTDGVLITSCQDGSTLGECRDKDKSINPVYIGGLFDLTPELVTTLNDYGSSCESIDFSRDRQAYLFCGKLHGKDGVFELDSAFNEIADYTDIVSAGDASCFMAEAYYLSKNRIIVRSCHGNVIVDLDDDGRYALPVPGFIEAISNSGELIAITTRREKNACVENDDVALLDLIFRSLTKVWREFGDFGIRHMEIVNVNTGEVEVLEIQSWEPIGRAAFSPDDRVLAYVEEGGFFGMPVYDLWLFDRTTQTYERTSMNPPGAVAWISTTYDPWPPTLETLIR